MTQTQTRQSESSDLGERLIFLGKALVLPAAVGIGSGLYSYYSGDSPMQPEVSTAICDGLKAGGTTLVAEVAYIGYCLHQIMKCPEGILPGI
jgi:hypothetical protein